MTPDVTAFKWPKADIGFLAERWWIACAAKIFPDMAQIVWSDPEAVPYQIAFAQGWATAIEAVEQGAVSDAMFQVVSPTAEESIDMLRRQLHLEHLVNIEMNKNNTQLWADLQKAQADLAALIAAQDKPA